MDLRHIAPQDEREYAVPRLNRLLKAALYLEDLYKRYHWQVSGPHFLPLHELFDEHMETLEHEIDDLGERIKALGGTPVWNPAVFAKQDILPEPDESTDKDLFITREAFEMQATYSDALREAAAEFDEHGFYASHDLLIDYLRKHELQAWFLREFIRKVEPEEYAEEFEANGSSS